VCGECGKYGRREMHADLCWGTLQLRDCLADLGVDGRKMTTMMIMIIIIIIIIIIIMECKTKGIPAIIGATETISKSFRKYEYMSNIPGKHEVKELQKTAILGTAHILRKVQM
jgi:hypothetical protein